MLAAPHLQAEVPEHTPVAPGDGDMGEIEQEVVGGGGHERKSFQCPSPRLQGSGAFNAPLGWKVNKQLPAVLC